ncbi:MAG: hypothetical protein RJB13_759 [Pseudomonadota bacterium]|jgi:hypothetical protein
MPKIARTLVGFGFIWMSAWAMFGALLGARLNQALLTEDTVWLDGLQRTLFRTAHAHMNSMSLTLIALGLSYMAARRRASEKTLVLCSLSALGGTVVFGLGLLLEAFSPPTRGAIPWASAISAVGGVVHIMALGLWGIIFLGRGSEATHTQIENR